METTDMNIAWNNAQSYVLINPTYSKKEHEQFYAVLKAGHDWPGHIWLATSGSSVQKWVGLSKNAVLASAEAVNQHLQSSKEDKWVNALPFFHVGGLGIWARAHLSGAKVYDFKQEHPGKWQAEAFYRYLQQVEGTLSALVPAQLHDLVLLGKQAPTSLRALIIGGGTLLSDLYAKAIALGWPLLPSYGLTECASQVATAALERALQYPMPPLQLLSHIRVCENEERLCFSGTSLLSAYAYLHSHEVQFVDPKVHGWLKSEDRGTVQNGQLHVLGRADAIVKVGGENVDLARLEDHLQMLRLQLQLKAQVTLIALPDARLGHTIHLASDSIHLEPITLLVEQFQQTVLPFERIRKIHLVQQLPCSALGKILRNELMLQIYQCEFNE